MDESLRVIDYIKEEANFIETLDGETISAAQMLERFLFPPGLQWTPIAKLSGGEKRRLYLLRILMGAPNILLLDEPTNDLDIQTLGILEDYLDDFPGAVVAVSHDRYFLDRVAEKILAFEGNGAIRQYPGGYSDYLNKKPPQEATAGQKPRPSGDKKPAAPAETKRPRKFTFKEQREYEEIDAVIAAAEKRLQEVGAAINAAGSDFESLQNLVRTQTGLEQELDRLLERWTYLNEVAEEMGSSDFH